MSRKVLIVTYFYPPANHPRASRWKTLAEEFRNRGYEITVVAVGNSVVPAKINQEGISSHFVGLSLRNAVVKGSGSGRPLTKKVVRILKRIHSVTWRRFYWPDYACLWIPFALVYSLFLMKKEKFDVVVSVSWPYSSHLVAYFLKCFWKKLYWIAELGDPFSLAEDLEPNNFRIYSSINRLVEKHLLTKIDSVGFPSAEMKSLYLANFKVNKAFVAPHITTYESVAKQPTPSRTPRRLIYSGTLHSKIRTPYGFLEAIKELDKKYRLGDSLELIFVGRNEEFESEIVTACRTMNVKLRILAELPKPQVEKLVEESDIVVNIGNSWTYALSSKVIEYVKSTKPILNVKMIAKDLAEEFLSKHPCSHSFLPSDLKQDEELHKLRNFIFGDLRNLAQTEIDDLIGLNYPDSVAATYEKEFCSQATG